MLSRDYLSLLVWGCALSCTLACPGVAGAGERSVVFVPLSKAPDWRDQAYLAAVPAATRLNGGCPVVIALDRHGTLRPETGDFLRRYRPQTVYMLDCLSPAVPSDNQLLGHWPLDDGQGLDCTDTTGRNVGRLGKHPVWDVYLAEGVGFDGRTLHVEEGSAPGSAKELTVAFWMKPDRVAYQRVMSKHDNTERTPGWTVMLRNTKEKNAIRFRIGGGDAAWSQSDVVAENAYTAGEWIHIACTHANGVSRIYLNGVLHATREGITWSTPNNTNKPLEMGGEGGVEPFTGMIDEVRIYHRALDEMEIQRLPGGIGTTTSGLVGYWPMDETEGRVAHDRVGGSHATMIGQPSWEEGHVDGGVGLRNEGDMLQVAADTGPPGPFSVQFAAQAGASETLCLLRKTGVADKTPPWSCHVDKTALIFRVGEDSEADLTIPHACRPGERINVGATFSSRTATVYVNGKRAGSRAGIAWRTGGVPPPTEFGGELDQVRLYNRALTAEEMAGSPPAIGLVGHWQLNSEANQTARRGPLWTAGHNGGGLRFDGQSDFVNCGTPDADSGELTVALWVRPEAPGCLIGRSQGTRGEPGWCVLLSEDRNSVRFRIGEGAGERAKGDTVHAEAYRLGEWLHLACTFGKGVARVYLDGLPATTHTGIDSPGVKGAHAPLILGALQPGTGHVAGTLDDVRLYSRVLSEDEILALFASDPDIPGLKRMRAETAEDAGCSLARRFWGSASKIVCCREDDYADGLVASALAARLQVPLLFFGPDGFSDQTRAVIDELDPELALAVGPTTPKLEGPQVTVLPDALAVLIWMTRNGVPVDYLAAANPHDRRVGQIRKVSLAAPMLAAGRSGAVVLLDFPTQWKVSFNAAKTVQTRIDGLPEGAIGWRTGEFTLNGGTFPFVLTSGSGKELRQVSIDRDGDGNYEGPFRTGDRVALGNRCYTVSIGPGNGIGRFDLRLTWPGTDEIRGKLDACYRALGRHPEYLCILGRPDVIPQAIVRKSANDPTDVPTDLPFSQADSDPFSEISVGRFIGEDVYSATLTAARGLVYDDLIDPSWTERCATAAWESMMDHTFREMGYGPTVRHDGKTGSFGWTSPLRNVAAIAHMAHSWYRGLGGFVEWESQVLLAPSVIESGGCLTMSLDLDDQARSVPARLLRNGAVCFAGNMRPGIAQQGHYRTEFWNAIVQGQTVG